VTVSFQLIHVQPINTCVVTILIMVVLLSVVLMMVVIDDDNNHVSAGYNDDIGDDRGGACGVGGDDNQNTVDQKKTRKFQLYIYIEHFPLILMFESGCIAVIIML